MESKQMENKQMDDQIERKIRDLCAQKVPQSETVDQKMEEAYHNIRKMQAAQRRKRPAALKFSVVAALLALVMAYCLKHPAIAAQIPLIGNIFRGLEGQVSYPGDYSKKSMKLNAADKEQADSEADSLPSDLEGDPTDTALSGQTETKDGDASQQAADQKGNAGSYQSEVDGVTVTLSEAAYDHNAIYLALLVQNKEDFVKDALYMNALCYDAQVKLYKADGSADEYTYESEGIFVRAIQGEFVDAHTFKGIFEFCEPDFELANYTSCELIFSEFEQQLKTGETEVIVVPDYGEVSRMIPDSVHYKGPWKFSLDVEGLELNKQEIPVHQANEKGFGIEKVVMTEYEIYAVPMLPEGTNDDYVATIWDADGQPLENRNFGHYLSMSHYDRDVSEVTVYLLKTQDFLDYKGNNAYLQPEKAIFQTTVRFDKGSSVLDKTKE